MTEDIGKKLRIVAKRWEDRCAKVLEVFVRDDVRREMFLSEDGDGG